MPCFDIEQCENNFLCLETLQVPADWTGSRVSYIYLLSQVCMMSLFLSEDRRETSFWACAKFMGYSNGFQRSASEAIESALLESKLEIRCV